MDEPRIPLVEVFTAIQGEGYHSGRLACFVRFAGCPLACEFAPGVVCDTPYMKGKLKVTLDALFENVLPFKSHNLYRYGQLDAPMLILTGGEPTASPHFDAVVTRGLASGYYVAVETNGTIWRDGLHRVHWITVSPKDDIPQTSRAQHHNHNPQSPTLSTAVLAEMSNRTRTWGIDMVRGGEFRYVLTPRQPIPPFYPAPFHYVSPAVQSDGSGEEWLNGFPGFATGAVDYCMGFVQQDPRWRISIQTHKVMGVR